MCPSKLHFYTSPGRCAYNTPACMRMAYKDSRESYSLDSVLSSKLESWKAGKTEHLSTITAASLACVLKLQTLCICWRSLADKKLVLGTLDHA